MNEEVSPYLLDPKSHPRYKRIFQMLSLANGHGLILKMVNPSALLFLVPLLLLLTAACSSGSEDTIISSEQQAGGPEYSGVIVTTDMAVGVSRIMFGVINRDGMP